MMKKIVSICTLLFILLAMILLTGCGGSENRVVIYSSSSPLRNTAILEMLTEQFPDYIIDIMYFSTGTHGARLMAEDENTEADIVLGLEITQMRQASHIMADLSDFDTSMFMPDLLDHNHRYLPWERFSFGIAMNEGMLIDLGLPIPTSYEDLLDPIYQGLIMMPDPRASSTGYMYLAYFIERMGEDEAFAYFDVLANNILTFLSSGSGVATALEDGEVAIGFVSLHNAVTVMERGAPLTITFFDEYAPSSMGGIALTEDGAKNSAALDVFEYLVNEVSRMDKMYFAPGRIFVNQITALGHYPSDIPYKLITLDPEFLARIQDRWRH